MFSARDFVPPRGEAALGVRCTLYSPVDVSTLFLAPDAFVQDAIACIDRNKHSSLALIVDEEKRLLNTLTEGDIRRGLLAGINVTDSVAVLVAVKTKTRLPLPVTAGAGAHPQVLLTLMQEHKVRQVPLLDPDGVVLDVVTREDLQPEQRPPLQAVVMAGGFGTRLYPLTEHIPKPMLPVGGRPLLEHIVEQLKDVGISRISVSTHYKAEKIMNHFGDGERFGVDISYVREESPLGTGGALGLLPRPTGPTVVINGDVLTAVDFHTMHGYHLDNNAMMTVAVRRYDVQVPYGVVECDGPQIRALREKPQMRYLVNAGMYLLQPEAYDYIPPNKHFNMTDLIDVLLEDNRTVVSFPVREYWLDIGQHADYERAQVDAQDGKWRSISG